ncbi:MAG: 4Fe-4S binding protein [Actinomycetaceae bacterium]|nr:4Fe-4S binding protein [Actinomycetaceae bacterium]
MASVASEAYVREVIQGKGVIDIRDDCKGCDQCVQWCPADAITTDGLGGRHKIDHSLCVNCGQCRVHCPFDRIDEVSMLDYVKAAIADPDVHVIAQPAPSVRVAFGEEFDEPATGDNIRAVESKMFDAIRKVGMNTVWDTNFAADMTITEEGYELVMRILNALGVEGFEEAGPLPQFTSCCPGWVRYAETRFGDKEFNGNPRLAHISSARSPVMMFGPVAKTYGAEKLGKDPAKIFDVAISPCTAKKFEVTRPEFISSSNGPDKVYNDVDAVITTREFAQLVRETGVDYASLDENAKPDPGMSEETGAAIIFGNTGGVMEAALRTGYRVLAGEELPVEAYDKVFKETNIRLDGEMEFDDDKMIREATIDIPVKALDITVPATFAVIYGSKNTQEMWRRIEENAKLDDNDPNKKLYVFVEVMNCPGGCINGGGQPIRRDA